MAFLTALTTTTTSASASMVVAARASVPFLRRSLVATAAVDPRSAYDMAAGFTYAVFWGAGYWKYPDKGKRPDVEILAAMLAIVWHVFCTFDTSVYGYLWGVGGASHIYSRMMLGSGNKDAASGAFVGAHMCGHIALLLLIMDILAKR